MRILNPLTEAENRAYNLREGGSQFTVFADFQTERVNWTRGLVGSMVEAVGHRATIWEPGCSAGDISGWFSEEADVYGCELVPGAAAATRQRYPLMHVIEDDATKIEPQPCDVLVLCEFLEHLNDPVALVERWMPLARYSVISHPLNDPGGIEPGHIWSYDLDDHYRWFSLGGHTVVRSKRFTMGPFRDMILSGGARE